MSEIEDLGADLRRHRDEFKAALARRTRRRLMVRLVLIGILIGYAIVRCVHG